MSSKPDTVRIDLTLEERDVLVVAAQDKQFERERYLTPANPTAGHDDCCQVATVRRVMQDEVNARLRAEVATLSALVKKLQEAGA